MTFEEVCEYVMEFNYYPVMEKANFGEEYRINIFGSSRLIGTIICTDNQQLFFEKLNHVSSEFKNKTELVQALIKSGV